MNIHHNARLTPLGRERMVRAIVEGRQMPQAAARAAGVCPRTARKWVARFKAEGLAGLAARSHAEDQRQGRALHPDRVAGMGLRTPLPHLRRASPATPALDPRL